MGPRPLRECSCKRQKDPNPFLILESRKQRYGLCILFSFLTLCKEFHRRSDFGENQAQAPSWFCEPMKLLLQLQIIDRRGFRVSAHRPVKEGFPAFIGPEVCYQVLILALPRSHYPAYVVGCN